MLTLWYIIFGWKEYNKSFRKPEQERKLEEPAKKPDSLLRKKDAENIEPTKSTDIKRAEPPKSIPIDPKPVSIPSRNADSLIPDKKVSEVPEIPDSKKPNLPFLKTSEIPQRPDLSPIPEPSKVPEPPKITPKSPGTSKLPDVPRLAPEKPKIPESPKKPDTLKEGFKPSDFSKGSDLPKSDENFSNPLMPSRRPDSVVPNFPPSSRNPVPQPNSSEFSMPPYLPGAPGNQKLSKDDELFNIGSNFNKPFPSKPSENLRDLSYAKGEFPTADFLASESAALKQKVQENVSKIPKYMEESLISNPDSLESDEEDE